MFRRGEEWTKTRSFKAQEQNCAFLQDPITSEGKKEKKQNKKGILRFGVSAACAVVSSSLLTFSSEKYCSSAGSSINDLPGCGFPPREPGFIIRSE